jgi:hypothetical protein
MTMPCLQALVVDPGEHCARAKDEAGKGCAIVIRMPGDPCRLDELQTFA